MDLRFGGLLVYGWDMRLGLTSTLVLALAAMGFCRVDYRVKVVEGATAIDVEMVIPSDGKPVVVQIPNWAPGSYRLVESFKSVNEVTALRASRKVVVNRLDDNSWEISGGMSGDIVLRYQRAMGSAIGNRLHMTGPANLMYVKGRVKEDCTLKFDLPAGWRSTCGLEVKGDGYVAPDYDVLIDNPVTIGVFESDFYELKGVKHEIAYYGGDVSQVNRAAVIDYCKKITLLQDDFWSGLPFKKYVWHFTVMNAADGGWGLEHLSSTTIGLASGLGQGTVGVMNHEYFHAWNVKRIRSKALGPFDYLVLPKTGALWMLEGVTDYYAHLLLYRYQVYNEDYMKSRIIRNVRTTRANPERMKVSPYDSSYRVGEAANGRGNSAGFGVNYYNTGWVVGLCLDIELRDATDGKYSFDDVLYQLWEECQDDKPGFEEHRIREIMVEMGGERMGVAYDTWVMKPGELPVEKQLEKIGYRFIETETTFADLGFPVSWGTDGRLLVSRGTRDQEWRTNDEIVEMNGLAKGADAHATEHVWEDWREMMKPGATLKLKVKRGEEILERTVAVKEGKTVDTVIEEMKDASARVKALREGWFRGPKNGGKPVVVPEG